MPQIIDRRISFNGGEISPWTDSRLDLEKYRSACRKLLNIRPTIYGGAFRRPGLLYMGPGATSNKLVRVYSFEFSVTSTIVLEFSENLLRFWTTGANAAQIKDPISPLNPYQIHTPWLATDLYALQFAQQNDIIVITHPNHPPQILSRLANNNWTLAPVPIEWPATLDLNFTATTLSLAAVTGASVALTSSTPAFLPAHVGSQWVIRHRRNDPSVSIPLTAAVNATTTPLFCLGEWSCNVAVNTGGTWEKSAVIERSYNKVTWQTLRPISSSGVTSGTVTGTEIEPAWLRVRIESTAGTPPASGSFVLETIDPDHYGLITILGVSSPTVATARIDFEAASTSATTRWEEGAWSGLRGYPRALTFHENRLIFGGTRSRPQTIWASILDDYFNFRIGTDADLGLAITLASDRANGIQWLVSQESLVIGTTGSEWVLGSRSSDQPLTAESAAAKRNTNYGSAHIQARPVHDTTLFIQRSARKVREFTYSFEKDGFAAQDLTLLAEHITAGGILQIAVQNNPETILYAVTGNGDLIGLTYERAQNVSGWFRHNTQGKIESVAVVSGNGEEDEVWLSILRTIDGNPVRYIERLQTGHTPALADGEYSSLSYIDSSVVITSPTPITTITGLAHLEAAEVQILADGSPHPPRTVLGGGFTLQFPASTIVVGLAYESLLEPTYLETGDPASLSKVSTKRITRATVELWQSLGLEISGNNGESWTQLEFRTPPDFMDSSPPLFTGIVDERIDSESGRQISLLLRQIQPLPFNLMSLHIRYDLNDI